MKEQKENQSLLPLLNALMQFIIVLSIGLLLFLSFGKTLSKGCGIVKGTIDAHAGIASGYEPDIVEEGIHLATGLAYDVGFHEVRRHCTACHSPALISQNRATREGWRSIIEWMQQTQGLWDLASDESLILDYLSSHYAPEETGRRAFLDPEKIEWYQLEPE